MGLSFYFTSSSLKDMKLSLVLAVLSMLTLSSGFLRRGQDYMKMDSSMAADKVVLDNAVNMMENALALTREERAFVSRMRKVFMKASADPALTSIIMKVLNYAQREVGKIARRRKH